MGRSLRVVTLNLWGTEPPLDRRLALAMRQLRALVARRRLPPGGAPARRCFGPHDRRGDRRRARLGRALRGRGRVATPDEQEGLAVLARTIGETRVLPLPEPRAGDRVHPALGAGRDRRRPDLGAHHAPPLPARRRRRARAAGPRDRRGDPRVRPRRRRSAADPLRRHERRSRQRRDALPARAHHARRPPHALPGRVAPASIASRCPATDRRRASRGRARTRSTRSAALARYRSPHRLRLRHQPEEGRPRRPCTTAASCSPIARARTRSARAITTR